LKYSNVADPQRIQWAFAHPNINAFAFWLGGKQFSYPSFNGQYFRVTFKINPGAFIDSMDDFKTYLNNVGQFPEDNWKGRGPVTIKQYGEAVNFIPKQGNEEYKPIGGGDNIFPTEYSVAGWFKW
jgi:hypothetical protein